MFQVLLGSFLRCAVAAADSKALRQRSSETLAFAAFYGSRPEDATN